MKPDTKKTIMKKGLLMLLVTAVFVVGIFLGRISSAGQGTSAADIRTISENKDLNQFWTVWKLLNDKYPFKEKIPADNDRIYGAISGMVDSFGDPYTMFFPPKEAEQFAEEVKGEFSGVGMEVAEKNGLLTVVSPLKGSPAEKVGILPGDVLVKINGETTENVSVDEAITKIRGKAGTTVDLTLARAGKPEFINVTITRATIALPVIDTKTQGDVFIINVYSFSENAPSKFDAAIKEFSTSGLNKLVIDLRNNPGGYLEGAVDIGSYLIPQGKIIVREDQGNDKPELSYRSHGTDVRMPSNLKTLVLINSGSASASEILAGAMAEHGVAELVGSQTFGKGSVQELIPLTDGSSVKITVAKWLTPNGISISEKGITPKYVVTAKPEGDKDPVLAKALQLLK